MTTKYDIVIPTVARPSLTTLLDSLDACGARPGRLVIVDDRAGIPGEPPLGSRDPQLTVEVVRSGGRGPAAARNAGFMRTTAPWVVFLDDDVVVDEHWHRDLLGDLADAAAHREIAAVQGVITVPLPRQRRPTDWERNVGRLAEAQWITADLAVRRDVIASIGGFDERFRRAYREDSDLALRILDAGWEITRGHRQTSHPVRPQRFWVSVAAQRGNADDRLLLSKHGNRCLERLGEPSSILPAHMRTTAALLIGALAGRGTLRRVAIGSWLAATIRFTLARLRGGPWTLDEVARMTATSAVIPPAATWWSLQGRRLARDASRQPAPRFEPSQPAGSVDIRSSISSHSR